MKECCESLPIDVTTVVLTTCATFITRMLRITTDRTKAVTTL